MEEKSSRGSSKPISDVLVRLDDQIRRDRRSGEFSLPPLPSVEQMRRDVANATCELQQSFFYQQNSENNHESDALWRQHSIESIGPINEDPNHRTQEETVCEELIINGKKYRHTFQKRVVLESQKTREIFLLPACSDNEQVGDGRQQDKYTSSNFDKYNRAFEDNGARLDLQVHNQEGGFNPMLVITPQGGESPDPMRPVPRPVTNSPSLLSDEDGRGIPASPTTAISHEGDSGVFSNAPLAVSHMYQFGKWDKSASILDPRLPTSLGLPLEVATASRKDDSIFCVAPAEWHHSDISYGRETTSGTTAKARIVACLQKFTQKSAQTGKQLYRSTYVQHTKIARWRSSETPSPVPNVPAAVNRPLGDSSHGCDRDSPDPVAKFSDVWKQGVRSPLGASDTYEASISIPPLRVCPYDRLQILQSLCPAAAAAIMILGRQMPEMRSTSSSTDVTGSPISKHGTTVTADAWCPRGLMLTNDIEDSLLFSMSDGAETGSVPRKKRNCLLRGGTLDSLLVYAMKIFRQNITGTYESLIPSIFMRLYPTFTIASEVVSRVIQRYLAFAPIEPGGMGCLCEKQTETDHSEDWSEALTTLRFLLKLLSCTDPVLLDLKLETKIARFAQLLNLDSRLVDGKRNVCIIDEDDDDTFPDLHSENHDSVPPPENTISSELQRVSKSLLDFLPTYHPERRFTESPDSWKTSGNNSATTYSNSVCSCYQRLNKFLHTKVQVLAEQITASEEALFDSIKLIEFCNIKEIEKGNTPSLSRCFQHFNELNAMIQCLSLMANDLSESLSDLEGSSFSVDDKAEKGARTHRSCGICSLVRYPVKEERRQHLIEGSLSKTVSTARSSSVRSYLCMKPNSHSLSLRIKRLNYLLESTLAHICDLAEELKRLNNFGSFLAVILGLTKAPAHNVSKRTKARLNELSTYMVPPCFTAYRQDLEAAKMPYLPYLGLMLQQLIHLDSGNPLFLPSTTDAKDATSSFAHVDRNPITSDEADANKIVNFWRCWKHYLILGYFMERAERDSGPDSDKCSYGFRLDPELQEYLTCFQSFAVKCLDRIHLKTSLKTAEGEMKKLRSKSVNSHTLP